MNDADFPPVRQTITRTLTVTTVETWTITIGRESTGPPEATNADSSFSQVVSGNPEHSLAMDLDSARTSAGRQKHSGMTGEQSEQIDQAQSNQREET